MDGRRGRLLLALAAAVEEQDGYVEPFTLEGFSVAAIGALCLVCVVLMCACRESANIEKAPDRRPQQTPEMRESKSEAQSMQTQVRKNEDHIAPKTGDKKTANGDKGVLVILSDQRPWPASLTPPLVRTATSRVLPAPPITEHQVQNKNLAGAERASSAVTATDESHRANQACSTSRRVRKSGLEYTDDTYDNMEVTPERDLYAHLGQKPSGKPSDYDIVTEFKHPEKSSRKTKMSEGLDDDYSELEEKTYPVEIINVSVKKTELLDPCSNATKGDGFSQTKEDYVYNNIGESDETVPSSLRQNLTQSLDCDDPYTLPQDESAGEFKAATEAGNVLLAGADLSRINAPTSSNQHNSSSILHKTGQNGEDYAIVHKTKSRENNANESDQLMSKERSGSSSSVGPAEPPRLYSISESSEAVSAVRTSPKASRRERKAAVHNYSKVTARESLASISARKDRTLYNVPTVEADNTYTTVDGWSEDVAEIGEAMSGVDASRLSMSSDTYAEIGTSEESFSSNLKNSARGSRQTDDRTNIVVPLFAPMDPLNQMSQFPASNNEDRNNSLKRRTDVQEYKNSSLKTNPHPFSLDSAKSEKVSLVPKNPTRADDLPENRTANNGDDYPDYEIVDDTISQASPLKNVGNDALQSLGDSSGNRKVGIRRLKLNY